GAPCPGGSSIPRPRGPPPPERPVPSSAVPSLQFLPQPGGQGTSQAGGVTGGAPGLAGGVCIQPLAVVEPPEMDLAVLHLGKGRRGAAAPAVQGGDKGPLRRRGNGG